jgi:hypothetical protein
MFRFVVALVLLLAMVVAIRPASTEATVCQTVWTSTRTPFVLQPGENHLAYVFPSPSPVSAWCGVTVVADGPTVAYLPIAYGSIAYVYVTNASDGPVLVTALSVQASP